MTAEEYLNQTLGSSDAGMSADDFLNQRLAEPQQPKGGIEGVAAGLEAGIGRAGTAFAQATVASVRNLTDLFGANNPVSKKIAGVEDYIDQFTTAQAKQDNKEISRIFQEAESKGLGSKVLAGLEAVAVSPETMLAQTAGYMVPSLAAGALATLSSAPITVAVGAQALMGGYQAAGMAKGDIYKSVLEYGREQGLDEVEADRAATEAQAYGGKNADLILMNAGLGALAASTGAEKIAARIIAGKGKEVTKKTIREFLKQGTIAGSVEAGTEGLQEGAEQISENIALQREGKDVPTFQNVPQVVTMGAAAGAIMGGGLKGIEFLSAEEKEQQDIERSADREARSLSTTDITSKKVVNDLNQTENAIDSLREELDTLEPTDQRAQQLRMRISEEQKKAAGIKATIGEKLSSAEKNRLAKEETPASITTRIEQIKVNMAGVDPTSRRYAQLQEELSTEEGKLVSQQQAELAKAIAEEPIAPEVAPTAPKPSISEAAVEQQASIKIKDNIQQKTDPQTGDKISIPVKDFTIETPQKGSAYGYILNNVANIVGIQAPKKEGSVIEPKRGTQTYLQTIQKLSEFGVTTLRVAMPSKDSQIALEKLVVNGTLSNPRDFSGPSDASYPTTWDIVSKKSSKPAPPTAQVEPVSATITKPTISEKPQTSPMIGAEQTQPAPAEGVTPPNINDPKYKKPDGSIDLDRYDADEAAWYSRQGGEYTITEESRKLNEERNAIRKEIETLEKNYARNDRKMGAMTPPGVRVQVLRDISNKITEAEARLSNVEERIAAQPSRAVTPAPETTTAPAGQAVGNRIKLGRSPQTYVIEEVIPQSETEKANGEQYYSVKNEKTGETQVVEAKDLKIVKGKGARKMFVGEEARMPQFMRDSLDTARAMAAAGKTSEEIRAVTGWFPGKYDGKMRWEIPDKNAYLKRGWNDAGVLPNVIDHPALFEAYPDLKYVGINHRRLPEGIYASYNVDYDSITLNEAVSSRSDVFSYVLHEIQHAIQKREGFSRGSSMDEMFLAFDKPKQTRREVFENYQRVAGEIEARDVQARANMTPEQLAATAPYSSENIAPEDAIVLMDSSSDIRFQGLTEQDFSPANLRDTATEPVPKDRQYSFEDIEKRVKKYFGGTIPEDVVIVNDTTKDYEFKGAYIVDNGQLIINQAYIRKGESISDIISHELGHFMYGDPAFQAAFKNFWNALTPAERAEIDRIINEFYNKDTGEVQLEERRVLAFEKLIENSKARSAWRKFLDAIGNWINKTFGTNIKTTDAGAMAVLAAGHKRFKSGEKIVREMDAGTMRMAARPEEGIDEQEMARADKRSQVAGIQNIGSVIDTPIGIKKDTEEIIKKRFLNVDEISEARKIEDTVNNAVSALGADVKADYDAFTNEGKTLEQIANEKKKSVNSVRVNIVKSETAIKKALSKAKLKPLDAKVENPVLEWKTNAVKKYMTKEGNLPGGTFQNWVKRNARLSKEAEQVRQNTEKLYDALRKIYKINKIQFILKGLSSVPPEMVEKLNEALAGKIDINTMPKELRKPITKMREHIDAMSSELIATGQLPDYLETKALNNLGVYLTRSYKIFSDPKWIQKIPAEKLTKARNFLYQQGVKNDKKFTLVDADTQLEQMLNDWAGEVEAKEKRRGGKLGAKDLSVMMQRSDIPKELRDVMGENNNIIFNYANTVSKISRFIADQNFLDAVKQEGAGRFLYAKDAAPSGFNTLIAAEESRTMSPLNGLRTTPEIAEAFAEFGKSYDATQNPFLYYLLAWPNAVGKANLTVGSILTQMRNIIGQPFFFVANGHTNLKVIGNEVQRLMKEQGLTKEEARQELIKMAAGEGLVGENAYAGELKEAFEQVGLKTFEDMEADEFARQFVALRLFRSGIKGAQRVYQKTDEFGKVIGWLNETDRVMRMNKGMSREEAMSIASERVRNTYPTYSQGSQALRLFRRQPFIGPFATFFYETFRTTYWNGKYAFDDIKKGGAARKEGITRLAGTMIQLSVGSLVASALSKMIAGIGDDEEEDVRRMLPPWEKDASMIWFPKDKQGVYNYINLSYLSPYNGLTDPFVAMLSGFSRGEDPVTIFTEAAGSFLEPFVSEQPVTAAIMDAARNRTETGKKVYNEEADLSTKTTDILLHIFGKTFTPGTIDRVRKRIIPAIYGETVGTRAPEPLKEIASELTGIRFQNLDMKQAFQNRAWEFNKSQNESERIFRDVATRRRRVTAEEQIAAYRIAEQSRFENWQEMYRDYMAVRRAGATEDEAIELMTDIKISRREAYMIADGEYMPYEVSDEVLRRSELNGNEVPLDEIDAIAESMPTTLQDLPKNP